MDAARVTVVKLGGSYAHAAELKPWLAAIAACAGHVVLVPGGGPFADAVREAQARMGFDDRVAHRMALTAMAQYGDRKSTRLNSSHVAISYAVFCLKKKKKQK